MNHECKNLDRYLIDDLSADEALAFARHLSGCDECRKAIDQQRWMDKLLQSPLRPQIDPVPARLVDLAQSSASHRRHRIRLAVCGLAAAATLFLAVGWWQLNRQEVNPSVSVSSQAATLHQHDVLPLKSAGASFVSNGDGIAIPMESTASDVTVVQVYPTVETERRWRRELAVQITRPESNGG